MSNIQVCSKTNVHLKMFSCFWILMTIAKVGNSAEERIIGPVEVCVKEEFNATCRDGEIILIQLAKYGRMQVGRCIPKEMGHLGCVEDVTDVLMSKCGGRRHCIVKVVDDDLMARSVCSDQVTNHLEVVYKCVQVYTVTHQKCQNNIPGKIERETAGYISLNFPERLLRDCPWQITVHPGQKLNLTLHSFTDDTKDGDDLCYKVASFVETGRPEKPILTCPKKLNTNTYTSTTNKIDLRLYGKNSHRPKGSFLLQFQAINCPLLENTGSAETTYSDSSVKVVCKHTGQTWYLTCKGTNWIGTAGNCTGSGSKHSYNGDLGKETAFPYGLLIAVAIGVALGVFCGGMLLGIVAVHKKRKRRQHEQRQESVYYGTKCPAVGQSHYCAEMNSLTRDHTEVAGTLTPCPTHRRVELIHITPDAMDHSDNLYNKPELTQQHQPQQPDLFLLDKNPPLVKDRMKYTCFDALSTPAMQSNR